MEKDGEMIAWAMRKLGMKTVWAADEPPPSLGFVLWRLALGCLIGIVLCLLIGYVSAAYIDHTPFRFWFGLKITAGMFALMWLGFAAWLWSKRQYFS